MVNKHGWTAGPNVHPEVWDKKNKDFYPEFYRTHHGLHVIDDVFMEECPACAERAKIIAICRFRGEDPKEALEKGIYDHQPGWRSEFLKEAKKRVL